MLKPLSAQQYADLEAMTLAAERNVDGLGAYLRVRGISRVTAVTYRLGVVPSDDSWLGGRMAIPSIGPRGVCSIRYRCLLAHDHHDPEVDCQKFLGHAGIGTRLWNPQAVVHAHDVLDVTEGETDGLTLAQLGLYVVGVPGVSNWKNHYARVCAGFALVRVWGDGDRAGREFARMVADKVGSQARVIDMPEGMDVNELYLTYGEEAIHERANSVRG